MSPTVIVPAFLGLPGGSEWLIILVIALLLFGKRLPEIMRGLGGSVREFKKGMDIDAPVTPSSTTPTSSESVSRDALPHSNNHHKSDEPPKAG